MELSGYRISETAAGKLNIKFVVINHSEADIGDLVLKIRLVTTAAKPDDPPITEFEAKVPALGPQEIKDVSASATTKLRIYELPDWQFIRAEVEITLASTVALYKHCDGTPLLSGLLSAGFGARVVETADGGRRVYLDRTAFYPTSGGQPFDTGTLGGANVIEVVDEEERVAHVLDAALTTGDDSR